MVISTWVKAGESWAAVELRGFVPYAKVKLCRRGDDLFLVRAHTKLRNLSDSRMLVAFCVVARKDEQTPLRIGDRVEWV